MSTKKTKLTVNLLAFPWMKFWRETWQAGIKCFTIVGARFSGTRRPSFFAAVKHINLQKSGNLPLQTLLFSCSNSYLAVFDVL